MAKRIGILTAGGEPGAQRSNPRRGQGGPDAGLPSSAFATAFADWLRIIFKLDKPGSREFSPSAGHSPGGRDKPHRMAVKAICTTCATRVQTYKRNKLDALVCLGGGGTHKNALKLMEKGLNVVTLPKTIDNDLALTDTSIGFDTALGIATEAIDRLHSTAHSHHRIIIAEIMGHRAGWLALGAGIAGGADVILIPEIPYDVHRVAAAIRRRSELGTNFSIVAVAEGALPVAEAAEFEVLARRKKNATTKLAKQKAKEDLIRLRAKHAGHTFRLAKQLEELTHLEARDHSGYVQRGARRRLRIVC
jgi:6-phosphofructokinase 1